MEWLALESLGLRGDARIHGPYVPVGEPYHETDPYLLPGVGATLRFMGGWLLDLDVSNALNEVYPAVRSSGFVVPGSPRTLRVGLRRTDRGALDPD